MQVFTIDSDVGRFRQFTLQELVDEREFDLYSFNRQFESEQPIGHAWKSPEVVYWDDRLNLPEGDYPELGRAMCFSLKAANVLRDELQRGGELLPLNCKHGSFFAYHVTRFLDALDRAASDIEYWPRTPTRLATHVGPLKIGKIKKHVFRPEIIANESVFKLAGAVLSEEYVTDQFVSKVNQHGLTGFKFRQVWPPPDRSIERAAQMEYFRQKRLKCKR